MRCRCLFCMQLHTEGCIQDLDYDSSGVGGCGFVISFSWLLVPLRCRFDSHLAESCNTQIDPKTNSINVCFQYFFPFDKSTFNLVLFQHHCQTVRQVLAQARFWNVSSRHPSLATHYTQTLQSKVRNLIRSTKLTANSTNIQESYIAIRARHK